MPPRSGHNREMIMSDADVALAEARIRARGKDLPYMGEITLFGCPIQELSKKALLVGMRIAWNALEREREFHATDRDMLKTLAEYKTPDTVSGT